MRSELAGRLAAIAATASLVIGGCVSVGPVASPSLVPTLSPSPVFSPTPTPTAAPTASPTQAPPSASPTQSATASPTAPLTAPPTTSPTAPPTATPTASATAGPTSTAAADRLDFTADPNYGLIELSSGFFPDPQTRDMLSGGSVDASYLGDGCRGFATAAPDLSFRYTVEGGFASLLRFYFEGTGDTTLIINSPSGEWLCNDDSWGTFHPTVDVDDPTSGRYDIWVGSYGQGQAVNGTLSITELDSNHPAP